MIVPEREKGVKSFRIPRVIFHALVFLGVVSLVLFSILSYDYYKILQQINENKHLSIENRQLKEQIQLFHMKINALTEDIERIHTFEKKLRIITGIEQIDMTREIKEKKEEKIPINETKENDKEIPKGGFINQSPSPSNILFENLDDLKNIESKEAYKKLKNLYEQKIATTFGLQTGYVYTKEWSELTKQSFGLAGQYAKFDYMFNKVKSFVKNLEVDIHELDQFLLDKDSYLKSTPTLLPTKGWITSYYGPRISPTSRRLRMHEGIDIGARTGTPIVASADGIVLYAGTKPGFGKFVHIDHGYGVETFYAHAKRLHTKKGRRVRRGDFIARIGNTGSSTGPHLHYEIRVNGTPVDPLYYVLD
jgi:murein DD-endopeptidase MepM/ murein hydrolase activator NlpD